MNTYSPGVPVLQTAALIREFTPETITGDEDDYAPDGNETYNVWRLQTDATRHITGLAGGLFGTGEQVRLLINIGSHDLVLKNNSGSSLVGNRFLLADGADQPLRPGFMALCRYDATSGTWRALVGVDVAEVDAILASVTDHETRIEILEAAKVTDEARVTSLEGSRTTDEARITVLEGLTEAKLYLSAGQQLTSNSTTFQDVVWAGGVAGLTLLANAVWHFRMTGIFISTVAAGFQFQLIGPTGAKLYLATGNFAPVGNFGSVGFANPLSATGTAANVGIEVWGTVVNGANAGVMKLQVAQHTATVESTDFLVQGTNLQATKVA